MQPNQKPSSDEPTKVQIEAWIAKTTAPGAVNDVIEFSVTDFVNEPLKYFKRFILEMKVQIDRWDLVTDKLYVHPHMMYLFTTYLKDDITVPYYIGSGRNDPVKECMLWGCNIIVNEHIPEDILIGYSDVSKWNKDLPDDGRNLALGKLNLVLLNRLNQMKAFW